MFRGRSGGAAKIAPDSPEHPHFDPMKVLQLLLFAAVAMGGAAISPAYSQSSGRVDVAGDRYRLSLVFSDRDQQRIRRFYGGEKPKKIPPGLARKHKLPPGLQKQLQRNGTLPPGLRGRYLPRELERKLTPLPPGYARLRVGLDFVLLDLKTRVILDLFSPLGGEGPASR